MRVLMLVVVVLLVGTTPVEAGPWACYTELMINSDTPTTRCSQECEEDRENKKQDSAKWLKSISACSPATASVFCTNPGNMTQSCFADLKSCVERDPRGLVAASEGKPLPDNCFEMKLDGTVLTPDQRKAAPSSSPALTPKPDSDFACYTMETTLQTGPKTYCDRDCTGAIEQRKELSAEYIKSITGCTQATGSVFCMNPDSPVELCYPDLEACFEADADRTAAVFNKQPVVDLGTAASSNRRSSFRSSSSSTATSGRSAS